MYYLRIKAATAAIKFTVEKQAAETPESVYNTVEGLTCSLDNPEACEACGS